MCNPTRKGAPETAKKSWKRFLAPGLGQRDEMGRNRAGALDYFFYIWVNGLSLLESLLVASSSPWVPKSVCVRLKVTNAHLL